MSVFISRLTATTVLLLASAALAQGQSSFTASPSSLTFTSTPGTPGTVSQSILISTSPGSPNFSTSLSDSIRNYISVPFGWTANTPMTVTLVNSGQISTVLSGTMTISAPGFSPLSIPITINPSGTGTSSIAASPSTLNFSFPTGSQTAVAQTVYISTPVTTALTASMPAEFGGYFSFPASFTSNSQVTITLLYPQYLTTQRTFNVTIQGGGHTPLQLPITITPGGTGSTSFTVSPTSLNYTYATGTTTSLTQYITLTSPVSTTVTPSLPVDAQSYFSIPQPFTLNAGIPQQVPIALTSPQSFTQARTFQLALQPSNSTLTTQYVTITINPGGTGTGQLSASPASLSYQFGAGANTPITQYVQITAPYTATLTTSLSGNLSTAFQVPPSVSTNTQFAVTLLYPYLLTTGTTGSLTLSTNTVGGGTVTIPIYVNTSAGGGLITATPSTVTFNAAVGTDAPPTQTVTLTAQDGSVQFVSASANSSGGWLTVSQSSFNTPSTLTLRANTSSITQPGAYTGTVTVSSPTGTVLATVNVTLNVITAVTVTPAPVALGLNGAAGSSTPATGRIRLDTTDSTIAFTAATTMQNGSGWLTVTPTSGNLGATITVNADATNLQVGTYRGAVNITAQGVQVASIPVTFTVGTAASLQVAPATLTFAHQTTSSSAPAAQSVQVTSNGAALNWTATPTSTGGWLQVSPNSGTTPGTINVSIVPTGLAAGSYTGQVSVASSGASNSPRTIEVTLTVTTPTLPQIGSVVNAASLAPTVAVPGQIITIRGTDLGPATGVSGTVDSQGFLTTSAGNVRVQFDGVGAPLLYVSATQINAVVPYEVANRLSTKLVVQYQNQSSRELELRVGETAPGVFTASSGGTGQAAALNQNGSVNSASNPAAKGSIIVLYATGHGQTSPAGTTGLVLGTSPRTPTTSVVVRIGGQTATVTYAGSAPGMVSGALQINARIPDNVASGSVPVEVQIGTATSQSVTIAVQ